MSWLDSASDSPDNDRSAGPPGEHVSIEVEFSEGTATAVIVGELDLVTRPLLAERLALIARQKPRRLVLDMARTSFMDCGSARLIAEAGRCLPDAEVLVIRHPSPAVRRLFELLGLDAVCEIEG
jgi:anti-anti-sigma factor